MARSPQVPGEAGTAPEIEIVVTVPTFRRPQQIIDTLLSLKAQITKRAFAVIVMENEAEEREGAIACAPLFEAGALQGMVIIAHERGNCSAYNAGWSTALDHYPSARFIAVIDDDETADPHWLENLCAAAERLDADIVGGPQRPIFTIAEPGEIAVHPVFAPPYTISGRVPALFSSGNLLVRTKVLANMEFPFLDTRFNFLGGGDADFLSRVVQKGYTLAWCDEAPVFETVPERRLEADWIRKRSLRNGVISTLVEQRKRRDEPLGQARVLAHSLLLLGLSPLRGALRLIATLSLGQALYPIYVGLGRVGAHFGYQNEQYRQAEKN